MEKLKTELVEAVLADIKQIVKENPNDMDLGKKIRSYFVNLPELFEKLKEDINKII